MRKSWRSIAGAAALVAVAWLAWSQLGPGIRLHTGPSPWPRPLTHLEVAEAWLRCIDCRGPFLKRLRELPTRSKDTVTKFLESALLNGPDSARVARHTLDLVRTWHADSVSRAGRGLPPVASFPEFMSRYQIGFRIRWESRAATALGVIGTPAATAALNAGLALPLNDKGDTIVHRMVRRALDSGLVALQHYTP